MNTKERFWVFWILFGVVALALSGCVTYPGYDVSSSQVTPSESDQAACRYEAIKATAGAPGGSIGSPYQASGTIANDLAIGMRQGELMALCLQNRASQSTP